MRRILLLCAVILSTALSASSLPAVAMGPEPWSTGLLGQGRASHAAAPLADGRVLVVGGRTGFDTPALASAELWDGAAGTFSPAGTLAQARWDATATTLQDGKVLVAGGWDGTEAVAGAELWDPATGAFSPAGELQQPRHLHTATLLQDGRVAIAGGTPEESPSISGDDALGSIEVWDPATGTFAPGGAIIGRSSHTATLLQDGRILFAGGDFWNQGGGRLSDAAFTTVWDPKTGRSDDRGGASKRLTRMKQGRSDHAAALLPDGTVLVIGGSGQSELGLIGSVERFNPARGRWRPLSASIGPRFGHAAFTQEDGSVIVLGGGTGGSFPPEVWRLAAGGKDFEPFGALAIGREDATYTRLEDGSILAVGGLTGLGAERNAERWVPGTGDAGRQRPEVGSVTKGPKMRAPRSGHTATALADGRIAIIGGASAAEDRKIRADIEVFDPARRSFAGSGRLKTGRTRHTATLLPDGRILVVGGLAGRKPVGTTELVDPATGTASPGPSLSVARMDHAATLLPDGRVLVSGGSSDRAGERTVRAIEVIDPVAGSVAVVGDLLEPRQRHTATLLADGRILLVGGVASGDGSYDYNVDPPTQNGFWVTAAEVIDPATGTAAAAGSTGEARIRHTATLLPDGRVLVVSDAAWDALSVVWDPATGDFTRTVGQPRHRRVGHAAVTLPDGRVLIAGGESKGQDGGSYQDGPFGGQPDLFDPATGTWSVTPRRGATSGIADARTGAAAALLPDGAVLITGGEGYVPSATTDIWRPTR